MQMIFPIIIVKPEEAPIYVFTEKKFGLISKGHKGFYNSGTIYDAAGHQYVINGTNKVTPATFLESLKYFQPMQRVDVNATFSQEVSLSALQHELEVHVSRHEAYWVIKDTIPELIDTINSAGNFTKLIKLFY
ncbi:hypothetical protein [Chitinophaga sp. Cy-1792]|uniref:hypothetical protein n=1 Tax=Chitinophaga sp. Cy-1792 TaxID=2608339 RepID=UPI00141F3E2F|nr:hypothetical protein [Chitinophaga sp. Cy-1792]NIG55640.1 hypothetical protein [Chitinophaga sp. Cy-1792]